MKIGCFFCWEESMKIKKKNSELKNSLRSLLSRVLCNFRRQRFSFLLLFPGWTRDLQKVGCFHWLAAIVPQPHHLQPFREENQNCKKLGLLNPFMFRRNEKCYMGNLWTSRKAILTERSLDKAKLVISRNRTSCKDLKNSLAKDWALDLAL